MIFSFHEGNLGQTCVLDAIGVRWRGVIVNLPNTSVRNEPGTLHPEPKGGWF